MGSLVQSEYFAQPAPEQDTTVPQALRQEPQESIDKGITTTKKTQRHSTKKLSAEASEKPKPKARARKAKVDKGGPAEDTELRLPVPTKSPFFDDDPKDTAIDHPSEITPTLTKSGKPRKPRVKKQVAEAEGEEVISKPKRTRATKASKLTQVKETHVANAPVVSTHFADDSRENRATTDNLEVVEKPRLHHEEQQDAAIWEVPKSPPQGKQPAVKPSHSNGSVQSLDLEEAVMRRRDWTPPQDTTVQSPFTNSSGKENKTSMQDANGTFTHMLTSFAYAQSPSARATTDSTITNNEVMAATKRRRVEVSLGL